MNEIDTQDFQTCKDLMQTAQADLLSMAEAALAGREYQVPRLTLAWEIAIRDGITPRMAHQREMVSMLTHVADLCFNRFGRIPETSGAVR